MLSSGSQRTSLLASSSSRCEGEFGLGDGHALNGIALAGEELVEEGSGAAFVIGRGLDIDELSRQLNWVDWHRFYQNTIRSAGFRQRAAINLER